ncbi:Crp/Fnr family transcriptional regulator [Polaromonas eurypsychrophila]|uniref:cAMP-binding protein n=1 Tax=Polaromonas eurypsychrophila TaxID=1614635 RepID=A0A916WD41_9BURK|nr:Crp/Fnr family transcriptional regulator [Polaromonas eurypsychrophila]GGA87788.1 cAMP-binding protein [Polaromonas eurypsychrophila]
MSDHLLLEGLMALMPDAPHPALRRAATGARLRCLEKGDILLRAGERWSEFWWVESGLLRLYYLDQNGVEANKNFFSDGQPLWPITSALRETDSSFFVAALEPTRVHAIPYATIDKEMAGEAAWTELRMRALQGLLDEKMWRERIFLQSDASQRYQQVLVNRPMWCERIPLKHLASWLGMTDVSLSRVRASLGLIRR